MTDSKLTNSEWKAGQQLTAPTRNWRFSGYINICASAQVQCLPTVFVSEIANFL